MPSEIAPGVEVETVGDLIGGAAPATVERIVSPRLLGKPPFPEPGIYFGMDETHYHSIHACSASGLKKMLASSMDYWASSVLNPDRDEGEAESTFKALGRAYHVRICEGRDAFAARYAIELEKEAFPDLIVTIADIRAAIIAEGGKPKGTVKGELIDQLLDLNPGAQVWDRMVETYNEYHSDKTMISVKNARRIEIAAAMIECDPQLKDAFTGGHAEVALFWYDEATGVPMKAKLDYLKLTRLMDLKSFSNPLGKPVQRAIDAAITNQKYYLPVVVYLEGIEAVKKLVRETKGGCVFEPADGKNEFAPALKDLKDWAWKWAHQDQPEVVFVFQQTGVAPVTRGRIMRRNSTYASTTYAVQFLKKKWGRCATAFGTDPWVDSEPIVATEDESLGFAATDFGEVA